MNNENQMSDDKYITTVIAVVAIILILSFLSYCSVDEHYANKNLEVYLEKGCTKEPQIGTSVMGWKCPNEEQP